MSEWITTCAKKPQWLSRDDASAEHDALCLVIMWSGSEPRRVGEVAFADSPGQPIVLGRGGPSADDAAERLRFCRQRAGSLEPTAPLGGEGISRRQCEFRSTGSALDVKRIGRCPVLIDGREIHQGRLLPGQVLTLKDQLILLCARRPHAFERRHFDLAKAGPFGHADAFGIVGESPAAWELREYLAFCAASDRHVLVLGESGTGKELAARALHQMSSRANRALVTRNASTFPSTLIDAELFGNAANYPNAGMPARNGVIGEADKSTLFLDEIGELPPELQAHLLRVLDNGGEYQRLGEPQARHSNFRLVAATNRDPTELRLDITARLTLQVQLPNLQDRLEDVPLLIRHLLGQAARTRPDLRSQFFEQTRDGFEPRIDPDLVEMLLRQPYSYNIRELDALLWKAVAGSSREYVALTRELRAELAEVPASPAPAAVDTSSREMSADEIVECLDRNDHNVANASRELGLKSRYALYRLMRKHGIAVERATK